MGRPCQQYSFRIIASTGALIYFVGTLAAGFCTTVPQLIVCQGMIQGMGVGVQYVPGVISVSRHSF